VYVRRDATVLAPEIVHFEKNQTVAIAPSSMYCSLSIIREATADENENCCCVALVAVLLPFGASAHAATPAKRCTQYKVAGKWLFVASNNYDTTLIVTQHGNKLSGPETIPATKR